MIASIIYAAAQHVTTTSGSSTQHSDFLSLGAISEILTALAALSSIAWAFTKGRRDKRVQRKKENADYVKIAFTGFDELITLLQKERQELIREIDNLKADVNILRELLLRHGVPLPSPAKGAES